MEPARRSPQLGPLGADTGAATTGDAEGMLARTPLAHLLAYAEQRKLTGTLRLESPTEKVELGIEDGSVCAASTTAPVAYLGQVLYELGVIDSAALNSSLAELASRRRVTPGVRHGDVLIDQGLADARGVASGLREQLERKVVHAFSLPPSTRYVFASGELSANRTSIVDPLRLVWLGVRAHRPLEQALSTLSRFGVPTFRLDAGADLERFGFSKEDRALADSFRTLRAPSGPTETLLAYTLVITRALRAEREAVPMTSQAAPRMFTPPAMAATREDVAPKSARRPQTQAPARVSNDARVNFQNAEIAVAQRDLSSAEILCRRATEDEPHQAEYLALLGWVRFLRTDKTKEPLEMLDRALDMFPGCERAYVYRAQVYRKAGELDKAMLDFRTAHTLNPANVEAAREVRLAEMRAKHGVRSSSVLFQKILKKS